MRVGIAGTGFMGSTHAAAWAETDAEIAGFVTRCRQSAAPLLQKYGARLYPSLDALLPDVDVVDICTPTHLHHEMVLKAAAAGRDIVCEKPLARTLQQGREMVRTCREAGVRLLVAHVVRFFPEYARAKALVDAGQVGQPAVVRLSRETFYPRKPSYNWFLDVERSGGVLLDLMIHDFDYARWVAGNVTRVFARNVADIYLGIPDDHALAILTHESGTISHIEGSWAFPPPTFRTGLEIAGAEGLIQFDSESTAPIALYLRQRSDDEAPEVPIPASPLQESPYTLEIKTFYNVLVHDAPTPVTAEDGLAALQIALAAIESARTGQAITLDPLPELSS